MKKENIINEYNKISENTSPYSFLSNVDLKCNHAYKDILLNNRQNTTFHHNNEVMQAIYNNIKSGDLDRLSENILKPVEGDIGTLCKTNSLRSFKNFLICTVALYSKAAIEGGLPIEDAYSLSDSFIQTIEETDNFIVLDEFWYKIVFELTINVKSILEITYSRLIFNCIFIK